MKWFLRHKKEDSTACNDPELACQSKMVDQMDS